MKRRVALFSFVSVVVVGAVVVIWLRHSRPKLVTEEDIGIAAAAVALITAFLTYQAASESRTAATESRRALQLHFRPGNCWLGFSVRDPGDPQSQLLSTPVSDPAPLWAKMIFHGDLQDDYEVVWIDDSGVARSPRHVRPEISGQEIAVKLEGIQASEATEGPRQPIAAIHSLKIYCKDSHSGARWCASFSSPRQPLGSYRLRFELVEK
ncbi:hypothetical protein [Micromonospora sp. RL09-050-HVF-A]|uniref:hypothetical protein n=1 Tax=Micromonospora sp. RL09-050-HVF-A TaxID=1703433 RepID=UPI001C5D645A|nr:hypothetical protein [Micromonospora sp. RL09-050-HVF-A]MBW4704615.1 hypothetical protein [Micromonospora sp. RL09-050-HVF-A]